MHRPIRDHLERYLGDSAGLDGEPEFSAHLDACRDCRRDVAAMAAQAGLLRSLAAETELEAAPGFYAKVMSAVDARRGRSVAFTFLDPVFGRRLVYACTLSLLVLGSFLFYSVRNTPIDGWNPVALMAAGFGDRVHVGEGLNPQQDREYVLLTLASYQE